ncbi:MAG: M1 family metallopeptidase, partial [Planctomycetota bacterium]
MIRPTFVCLAVAIACVSSGTRVASGGEDRFAQLGTLLPSPSESRLASGAPGPGYWQQRVDYDIDVTLDAATDEIRGRETVTYHNDAPHELAYLWLQLDPNRFAPDAPARTTDTGGLDDEIAIRRLTSMTAADRFDGSMRIGSVTSEEKPLRHAVIGGLLRVVPPGPIAPGDVFTFDVTWAYTVNDIKVRPGRTGYERLDDGEKIFAIAQWYPRLCAYTDYGGWRVKQFLGRGEFTLEFGDFDVRITAPADHLLYATGELRNAAEVLTEPQRRRLADLGPTPKPVVTAEEAAATRGAEPTSATKTWRFAAKNVRDFAFASSRTFAWDACEAEIAGETVVCQALYPVEGRPLWDRYAARVTRHAIEVYSDVTGIPYPYPHATTFLGVVRGGMEYPMISFNGPRPEEDGTYSKGVRDFVVSVIIHEVGHNWFPMIVNSDERHWMWLDEGVNTFVEQIARRRWSTIEGTTRADPHSLRGYQKDKNKRQVMTQGDAVFSLGANAYAKPAVALNILRETVLGRENFD